MSTLEGKYALVTGGGTGIGLGIARRLVEAGAVTTLAGRRAEVLEEAAETLRADVPGAELRIAPCDVTDYDAVLTAAQTASNADGHMHICVANAGFGAGSPFLMMDPEQLNAVLQVNVVGAFSTMQAAGLRMRENGGSIIAISSIAGALGGRFRAAYACSKAALDMMVKTAADELGGFNIRVNSIRPGVVKSEATEKMFEYMPHIIEDYERNMALRRVGEPEEIGDAVVWLASQQSSWVTGQNIAVDGGHTLRRAPDLEPALRAGMGDDTYEQFVAPGFGPNN